MSKQADINYSSARKYVSKLYKAVLTHKMCVRDALARFPKGCSDKTIAAAWHALCYLDADEDMRKRDALYKQEQDEYIAYIAHILSKGLELPSNIISSYNRSEALIPAPDSIKGILQHLKRFLSVSED